MFFLEYPTFFIKPVVHKSELDTGIIIPLFTSADSYGQVNEVIQAKRANPQVPFVVVVNYGNGPGDSFNEQNYASIKNMQEAGIVVLGYVATNWGARSIPSVEEDMLNFSNWYKVNGIFLDQMYESSSNTTADAEYLASYYSSLTSYAQSLGMTKVIGNSGVDVPWYLIGTVDQIGIFENPYIPPLWYLAGWHLHYNKSNFWFVSYNISSVPSPYFIAAASDYVSYLYITNGSQPNPYGDLPAYFSSLVSDLGALVPVTISSQSMTKGDTSNRSFSVTVAQPDGYSDTLNTPATFNVLKGSTVTITIQDNSSLSSQFGYWSNGSTNRTITITPETAVNLVAYPRTSENVTSPVAIPTISETTSP